jgi:hypothetical protein
MRRQLGHIHFFTKDNALATLRDAGYEVVDWFYTHGALEAASRSAKGMLLRLPRQALFAISPDFTVRALGGYSLLALAK